MDVLCQRLETLTGQLAQSLSGLHQGGEGVQQQLEGGAADLLQAAHVLQSVRGSYGEAEIRQHDAASGVPTSLVAAAVSSSGSGCDNDNHNVEGGGDSDGQGEGEDDDGGVDIDNDNVEGEDDDVGVDRSSRGGEDDDTDPDEPPGDGDQRDEEASRVGALVRDSYGRLR